MAFTSGESRPGESDHPPDPSRPARRSARRPAGTARRERTGPEWTGRAWGIGGKLGALVGALLLVLVGTTSALLLQAHGTTQEYDRILARQVSDALAARQVQVTFKRQVQEWKDILLRGFTPADLTAYTANFRARDAEVDRLTDALIASTTDPKVRTDVSTFRSQHAQLDADYRAAYATFVAGQGRSFVAADRMVRGKDRPPTDLLDRVVDYLNGQVAARVAAQKSEVAARERVGVGLVLALVTLLAGLAVVAIRRLVAPVRGLTRAARRVADESLPAAIAQIRSQDADADPPVLPVYRVRTRDELADLADAFAQVQTRAVELAADQHRAEREAAQMLVNLGRRNQNLLGRLLTQVSELERTEQDPQVLGRLFQLDHAATRIRRNAESMLVLAGAVQTRTFSVPVPFEDVIRAALSEVEDYVRVDLYHIEEGLVSGSAAADVVHLLAELIENATTFSPPQTQVTVVGQRVREGYRIRVTDQGVGMTHRELTEANQRILQASRGSGDAKLLGLYVVGRLAARRGIEVVLEPSATRGITATVLVPPAVLAQATPLPPAPPGTPPAGVVAVGVDPVPAPEPIGRARARRALPAATAIRPTPIRPAPVEPTAVHPTAVHPTAVRPTPVRPTPIAAPPTSPLPPPAPMAGPAGGSGTHPPMPKRVRGAQLAGLDLGEPAPAFAPPEEWSRWNLRSFQLDVEAARRMLAEQGTGSPEGLRSPEDRPEPPPATLQERLQNRSRGAGPTPIRPIDPTVGDRSHDQGREGR